MIDWMSFLIVFATSLGSAVLVVALYSFGIRFLAIPPVEATGAAGPSRDDEEDDVDAAGRPVWATVLAYTCFVLSAACVVFGIYLIVMG